MSPASSGNPEVEKYIGACLITQNRPLKKYYNNNNQQNHQHQQRWAPVPLITWNRAQNNVQSPALSRLVVHTQGAPLILTKNYNNAKKYGPGGNNHSKKTNRTPNSDESSVNVNYADGNNNNNGNNSSSTFVPRVIKPRKRRKKERKPGVVNFGGNLDSFNGDFPGENFTENSSSCSSSENSYSSALSTPESDDFPFVFPEETPRLHHSFEEILVASDDEKLTGVNNQESSCQCRYCDPSGQIWDVARDCYSPFLTDPTSRNDRRMPTNDRRMATNGIMSINDIMSINVPIMRKAEDRQNDFLTDPMTRSDISLRTKRSNLLLNGFKALTLVDDRKIRRNGESKGDLEVSTEIVTSLNGHRDIEIRFFSS